MSERVIKFRAWDKEKKMMAFNVHNEYDTIGGVEYSDGSEPHLCCFGDYLEDENWVIMQYTGLKDKNGVEIYEGDVVSIPSPWSDKNIVFEVKNDGCNFNLSKSSNPIFDMNAGIEVIGNINQNPELLEGEGVTKVK